MNKKVKKKNQIPEYYASSSIEIIKKIQNQLIKNLLP